MLRPRLLVPAGLTAAVALAGVAAASNAADDRPDAPRTASAADLRDAAAALRPITGDDGLTYARARRARTVALRRVAGRVVQVDRERTGRVRYEVQLINRSNVVREVELDRSYRVVRVHREGADGLTYATAGRAAAAARRSVPGIVTDIEREDEGRVRWEVEVLTSASRERTVHLSSSYAVVAGDDADGD